jgi:peptide/nickel transport system substrate-binding protein
VATNARWYLLLALVAVTVVAVLLGAYIWSRSLIEVPAAGGVYTEGLAGQPLYLNPILSEYSQVDRDLCSLIFGGLVSINAAGSPQPDLAESWAISDDGLAYTFSLRQQVLWHDGAPFTAQDVLYTVGVLQDPSSGASPDTSDFWSQVRVDALGMHTVRFTLPQPFSPFLSRTAIGLLPAHLLADVPADELASHTVSRAPVGTGPFILDELTADSARLIPNPDHYLLAEPLIDAIEFHFYPTHQAALQAYRDGEVLGVSRVWPEDLVDVWSDPGLKVYSAPLAEQMLLFANIESYILLDPSVRKALVLATDRQAIVDEVLLGQGLVAHGPVLPFSWAYDPALTTYEYDPEFAADVLDMAGWADVPGEDVRAQGGRPLSFQLLIGADAAEIAIAQMLIDQWAQVGIKAVPRVVTPLDLVNNHLRPREYELALFRWQGIPSDPDTYALWHSSQAEPQGGNLTMLRDDQIDQTVEEGRLQHDPLVRKRWYDRFQQRFTKIVPIIPLYHPVYHYAISGQVTGVQVGPLYDPSDRFRSIDRWMVETEYIRKSQLRLTPGPVLSTPAAGE